ncbi:hypothetical protein N1851_000436 [Merluccius polli]|uniref:Endonuclease/exonuclease/phosphatase domain-containing protein n=1 Tax=Merluccius polli TaxID=89951 RepID=A0AA47ND50_MERPO|nr:hypothetical protein N1851_000436 [Merluccius polli]
MSKIRMCTLKLATWAILIFLVGPVFGCLRRGDQLATHPERRVYLRCRLLELRPAGANANPRLTSLLVDVPHHLLRGHYNKRIRRKRGSRGGIRNRLRRRGSRLPLPAITLSNVRSLNNKLTELSALQYDSDYRQTSLFCFTESWLSEDIDVHIDGFNIIRLDRDAVKTRKAIGGGLCLAVNNKCATNYSVRESESCRHYKLLTVSFRPHYLPREFTQMTVILAYVPGPDYNLVADRIADFYHRAVTRTGEQPVFLLGDFNRCDVTTVLPNLEQYVTSPKTRQNA